MEPVVDAIEHSVFRLNRDLSIKKPVSIRDEAPQQPVPCLPAVRRERKSRPLQEAERGVRTGGFSARQAVGNGEEKLPIIIHPGIYIGVFRPIVGEVVILVMKVQVPFQIKSGKEPICDLLCVRFWRRFQPIDGKLGRKLPLQT